MEVVSGGGRWSWMVEVVGGGGRWRWVVEEGRREEAEGGGTGRREH